ncbi:MAG: hypothetical protein JWN41_215 [Thermoleophilia bacterium]|nr:hypothetical protein [Thermoleophilia bacterium]
MHAAVIAAEFASRTDGHQIHRIACRTMQQPRVHANEWEFMCIGSRHATTVPALLPRAPCSTLVRLELLTHRLELGSGLGVEVVTDR